MKKILLFLPLLTLSLCTFSKGWHITTQYYTVPNDQKNERTEEIYLYNGFMKMVNGDLTTIFNLKKSEITYINTRNRTYWNGNTSRFNKEVRTELEAQVERMLEEVEEHKQDEMRSIYMEMIEASFPEAGTPPLQANDFNVSRVKSEKASGFNAIKYEITESGLPLQTMWISPDLSISKDFDFISLSDFLNKLASGAYAASFEGSQEYFELLEKGYPVKVEIRRGDGSKQISEVQSAKRTSLDESDFSIPNGYNSGTLTEVGVWDGYM
ncbi:MAG: DUF4412 domain-containing protein [Bacteroidales bacterium]